MTRLAISVLVLIVLLQACSNETKYETALLMLVTEYTIKSPCKVSDISGTITFGQSENASVAVITNDTIKTEDFYFMTHGSEMKIVCEDGGSEIIPNIEDKIKNVSFNYE